MKGLTMTWWKDKRRVAAALLMLCAAAVFCMGAFSSYEAQIAGVCAWLRTGLLCFALIAAAVLLIRKNMKSEHIFLLLGIGFGLLYMVCITPLSAPDEGAHYEITLKMAANLLGRDTIDATYVNYDGLTAHINSASSMLRVVNGLFSEGLTGVPTTVGHMANTSYPPAYLPQLLGAIIAIALGMNGLWVIYLGYLLNLSMYITLVWLAIRLIPRGKPVMLAVSLLPMAMQQAASLSPDAFINGLSFLFIALCVRAMCIQKPMAWREMTVLAVVAVLLSPAKAVYTALLLLLFLIPKERFGKGWIRWAYVGGVLLTAVAVTVVVQLGLLNGGKPAVSAAGRENGYSLRWILNHPVDTVILVVRTLATYLISYLYGCVGATLSGFSLEISNVAVHLFIFISLFVAMVKQEEEQTLPVTPPQRLTFVATAGIVMVAVLFTMLLAWTTVSDPLIQGVQGRYFLPIAPLLLFALDNRQFTAKADMSKLCALSYCVLHVLCLNKVIAAFLA